MMTIAIISLILVMLGIGVMNCFFGARCLKFVLFIYGFVLGLVLGIILTITLEDILIILISLAVAILCGVLAYSFYKVGIFLIGGSTGALILFLILSAFSVDITKWYAVFPIVAAFIVAGIFTLKFKKQVIVISTSLSGASAIATFGGFLATSFSDIISPTVENMAFSMTTAIDLVTVGATFYITEYVVVYLISLILLAAGGSVIQFMYTSKKAKL